MKNVRCCFGKKQQAHLHLFFLKVGYQYGIESGSDLFDQRRPTYPVFIQISQINALLRRFKENGSICWEYADHWFMRQMWRL
ncbi:MAG: hypothetical protein IPM61_05080 [Chlorobi bacterium]|nr:hypothetical protein [Chlorobiota bacterium]